MIALEYCQQLLELYILAYSQPDNEYNHENEPVQWHVFDRHTTQHIQQIQWKPSNIKQRLISPFQESPRVKKIIFDTYEPKPYLVIVDRDKSDDKYRLEVLKKKKEKKNARMRDTNLPYNEYISPARQIQVKLNLSKKPLKDYQTYDSDGSIMRKREQVRQLSPIVNLMKSRLQSRVEKKYTSEIQEETITNQQALFKLKVSTKVRTQYEDSYNFEGFPLKPGVKLIFTQSKKEEIQQQDDEELTDADAYQLQKILQQQTVPNQLYKLPKKQQHLHHERSFRTLKQNRGSEYL